MITPVMRTLFLANSRYRFSHYICARGFTRGVKNSAAIPNSFTPKCFYLFTAQWRRYKTALRAIYIPSQFSGVYDESRRVWKHGTREGIVFRTKPINDIRIGNGEGLGQRDGGGRGAWELKGEWMRMVRTSVHGVEGKRNRSCLSICENR